MTNQTKNQTKAESLVLCSIGALFSAASEKGNSLEPKIFRTNVILVQNIGKDPPGRSCCPGANCCLCPDNSTAASKGNKSLFAIELQAFKQIQNPKILTINF